MSDTQAVAALPFYLDIIPQQWFFQLSGAAKSSLASLKEAFLSRFSVKKANFDVNLFHIQQNPDESVEGKIEKVPRGIRGEKSSKDLASSRNLVSTIGALASPKMGDGTRCPEG